MSKKYQLKTTIRPEIGKKQRFNPCHVFPCCRPPVRDPVYESFDPRFAIQRIDRNQIQTSYSALEILIDYPLSSRRTKTGTVYVTMFPSSFFFSFFFTVSTSLNVDGLSLHLSHVLAHLPRFSLRSLSSHCLTCTLSISCTLSLSWIISLTFFFKQHAAHRKPRMYRKDTQNVVPNCEKS
jgi:hypothetical protein